MPPRRSKSLRWLAVPALFTLVIFYFIHFSVRLDGQEHTAVKTRPNAGEDPYDQNEDTIFENLRKNIHGKEPLKPKGQVATVTVTIKETVTFAPASSPDSPIDKTANRVNPNYRCDPYARPGYYSYGIKSGAPDQSLDTTKEILGLSYVSLDPECPITSPSISSRIRDDDPSIVGLSNKTVVLFGDQLDRDFVSSFCSEFRGHLIVSAAEDTHLQTLSPAELSNRKAPDTLPRRCYLPQYDFSLSSYFFYAVSNSDANPTEEAALWKDGGSQAARKVFKMDVQEPYSWQKRLDNALAAIESLHRASPEPDVLIVNFGLWDLLRFEQLTLHVTTSDDDGNNTPARRRKTLSKSQLETYTSRLDHFLQTLREKFPHSRIIYRQTHYPMPTISTAAGESKNPNQSNRYNVFAPFKIHQISQIARSLASKWELEYWNIGFLTRDIPKSDILHADGVYPNQPATLALWGEGLLEYTVRTPKL